jgi:CubicO group peptidase (beta-lactamase class C family)
MKMSKITFDARAATFSMNRRMLLAGTMASIAAPALALGRCEDSLDAFLNTQLRTGAIPGMAIGIARQGEVVFKRGYGFADLASRRRVTVDTMFHLASVTKTVTATAVMMLVEEGKIDLDAPANRYLDFDVINPAHPEFAITVRHLLMHMSSISDRTYYDVDFRVPGMDSPQALDAFLRTYLVPGGEHYAASGSFSPWVPGSSYDYCNVGYGLLGYLAGRVAGEDLRIFSQRRLFAPLGMRHVSWTIAGVPTALRATPYDVVNDRLVPVEPVGFPDWPVGMLRASIAGFMPFVAASANGGAVGGTRILSAPSVAEMLAMNEPPGLPTWLTGQGLGWAESLLGPMARINHWGGDPGVFTAVYLDPASATGIAIFTNTSATSASRTAIKAIAERLFTEAQAWR